MVDKSDEENLICESIPLSIDFESEKSLDGKSQLTSWVLFFLVISGYLHSLFCRIYDTNSALQAI